MALVVTINGGFAEVDAGSWLAGRGQPAAFFGALSRRRRTGWFLRDRSALDLVETTGRAWFADASRPFLTYIPCAAPLCAVSSKVLCAPASARAGAELVKTIPMGSKGAFAVTKFAVSSWVVMASASRTTRISVAEGEVLSVRPGAVVAWTGPHPTGYVQRIGIWDILLPRAPRELMLHFYGPCIVWAEGSPDLKASNLPNFTRRAYGV